MKKNTKKKKFSNTKTDTHGITLVALVITIVILIILATVTVNVAFGDGGLIDQAKLAAEKTANSIYDEEASIANLTAYLNEQLGGGEIAPPDIPEDTEPPVITSFTETEVTANSITVSTTATDNSGGTLKYEYRKGNEAFTEGGTTYQFTGLIAGTQYTLEVKVTDEAGLSDTETITVTTDKGALPTDGSFDTEKGVNTPNIGANMELVVFDEGTSEWKKDETNSGYSYIDTSESGKENKSEWANAKVTTQVNGENVESYFVWIPRYAYKINGKNDIDIVFIKGTGTEAAEEGKTCKYANDSTLNTSTDYIIHPAFTTNADLGGGWDEELPGIWIGKYEAARSDTVGATQGSATTIKVQPGVTSFRSITIGDMYTYAKAYSTDLKSHMLKNSEWGAVAYLTESKYGRNGTEVSINNNGETYYTGGGAEKAYINNVLQSSTGNVYGIYDLSGNAYEYVASYYSGSTSSNLTNNGGSFASQNGSSDEYSTAYTGTSASSAYKYGDATHETSGWHEDNASFVYSRNPFFLRGGYYSNGASYAGVFCFYYDNRLRPQQLLIPRWPSSVMCNLLSEQKINFF